jgi:hypothetical protein
LEVSIFAVVHKGLICVTGHRAMDYGCERG